MNWFFVLALFLFWVMLSASLEPLHLITGAIVSVLVVSINPKNQDTSGKLSILSTVVYIPWLFFRVMKSGLHVCKLILHPSLPIKPAFTEHKTKLKTGSELTVIGNSITLTPGTITIEIEPGKLLVHSLDAESQGDITSGELDKRISALFEGEQETTKS